MTKTRRGIARYSEISNHISAGWVVRERFNDEKKPVSLDLGCHIGADIFVSIPIHFQLKSQLLPIEVNNSELTKDGSKYYLLPNEMQVAVGKFTNKRTGKECPILIPPSEKHPAVFISAIALDMGVDSIINMTIENGLVLRKYIDKNRKNIAIISVNPDSGLINPTVNMTVKTGIVGQNVVRNKTYMFGTAGIESKTSDDISTKEPVRTEYIDLPWYIKEQKKGQIGKKPVHDNKESK